MIRYLTGDITLTTAEAIAHGVAPNDDFKTGLGLAIREQFPSMVKDFRHYCHAHHPIPGDLFCWAGVGPAGHSIRVINLLTQEPAPTHSGEHPGKAHLEYVNHALHALARLVRDEGIKSLALPRLATGVGGLDWNDVKPVIEKVLGPLGIDVFVYETYKKGVRAASA